MHSIPKKQSSLPFSSFIHIPIYFIYFLIVKGAQAGRESEETPRAEAIGGSTVHTNTHSHKHTCARTHASARGAANWQARREGAGSGEEKI